MPALVQSADYIFREYRMQSEFTAIIEEAPEGGYWAICPEVPGANGQGETIEATKENLRSAVELILQDLSEDVCADYQQCYYSCGFLATALLLAKCFWEARELASCRVQLGAPRPAECNSARPDPQAEPFGFTVYTVGETPRAPRASAQKVRGLKPSALVKYAEAPTAFITNRPRLAASSALPASARIYATAP